MSRGFGKIQRDVLALIEGSAEEIDTFLIARTVYGADETTAAQIVAVRRALRGLEGTGRIGRVGRRYGPKRENREYWATSRRAAELAAEFERVAAEFRATFCPSAAPRR